MAAMPPGSVLIRPSSKGDRYLTLSWKVTNDVCQHVQIKEGERDDLEAIAQTL